MTQEPALPHTAGLGTRAQVTRAIYHHAREFLKKSREGREELPGAQRAQQAVQAMVQGTRAVILETQTVDVIVLPAPRS